MPSSSEKDNNASSNPNEAYFLPFPVDVEKPRRSLPAQAIDIYNEVYSSVPSYVRDYFDSADSEISAQNNFASRVNSLARADLSRRINKIRSDAQRQSEGKLSWYEKALLYNPLVQNTIGNPVYDPITHSVAYEGSNGLVDGLLGGLYNFGKAFVSSAKGDPNWGRRQDDAVVSKVRDKYKFWDDYQKSILEGKSLSPKAPPSAEFYSSLFPLAFKSAAANLYDLSPNEALRLKAHEEEAKVALERYKILSSLARSASSKQERRLLNKSDALATYLNAVDDLLGYAGDNITATAFKGLSDETYKRDLSSISSAQRALGKFLNELTPEERLAYDEARRKYHLLNSFGTLLNETAKGNTGPTLFRDEHLQGDGVANIFSHFGLSPEVIPNDDPNAIPDTAYYKTSKPAFKDLKAFFSSPYTLSDGGDHIDTTVGYFSTPAGRDFLQTFYDFHAAFSPSGLFPLTDDINVIRAQQFLKRLVSEDIYKRLSSSNLIENIPGNYQDFLAELAQTLAGIALPDGNPYHRN